MRRSEMTLILMVILIMTAVLISGCGKKDREAVIAEYGELLEQAVEDDGRSGEEKIKEIEDYLEDNLRHVGEEDADYMVYYYAETAWRLDKDYMSGRKIKKMFSSYMSDMMTDYIGLEILDEEEPLTEGDDGSVLRCDWQDIAERAVMTEELVGRYKKTLKKDGYAPIRENIRWKYEYYINLMLIGTSNNPLFTGENGEIDKNIEDSYVSIAEKNSDTATAWAINEFFTYLDSMGYRLDYKDASESRIYYDTCNYIVKESGKRVFQ